MASSTPPGVNLDDDQRPALRGLMIAMLVLPTVAVVLRFWSRAMLPGFSSTPIRFWWDDWTALIAAVCLPLRYHFHEEIDSKLI